jgi:hypothetical protein
MRTLRLIVFLTAAAMLGGACGAAPPGLASAAPSGAPSTGPTAATQTPLTNATTTPGADETPAVTVPPTAAPPVGTVAPDFQYVFEIPDDPITVSPTLDDSRMVEGTISTAGGQISATAADGTTFELTVPADALVTETLIQMIPVSSLEGMPFGTDPHAVQLEPSGLRLLNFATLTITPPTAIPADQQILFGYEGAGENLTLALPVVDSAAIAIELLHFSGAGVTSGTTAQTAAAQPRLGADAEARISSAIAAELGRARQAALLGTEEDPPIDLDAIDALMRQFQQQVVDPRVAAAGQSCAAGTLAVQTVLGQARQRALLGVGGGDEGPPVEAALLDTVAGVCTREEYQRCHDQHVIQNMVPTWLGWARQAALLGGSESSPVIDAAEEYARKCLVFEMRFESQATLSSDSGWDSTVTSDVEVRFDTDALRFNFAQAELVNSAFVFKAPGCQVTNHPGGGTFNAIDFKYIRDTHTPTDQVGYVRDLEFGYNPGATSESATLKCGGRSFTVGPTGLWSGTFLDLHRSEGGVHDGSYTFLATDWEIFGNAYFAKKEWIKTGEDIVEAGTFKLYHTPE